jgi:hypothetical protein
LIDVGSVAPRPRSGLLRFLPGLSHAGTDLIRTTSRA